MGIHSTNHAVGVQGEDMAAQYLLQQGYNILARRYKTKFGEIDLIVEKEHILCFVEVKIRQSTAEALESITARARTRIEKSALYYLSEHPEMMGRGMRFDVIAIAKPFQITHLDNAWEAGA